MATNVLTVAFLCTALISDVSGCSCFGPVNLESALQRSKTDERFVVLQGTVLHEIPHPPRRSLQSITANETRRNKNLVVGDDEEVQQKKAAARERKLNHLSPPFEQITTNRFVYYSVTVHQLYQGGCDLSRHNSHRRLRVVVKTRSNSAQCGVILQPRTYLLTGTYEFDRVSGYGSYVPVLSVNSCSFTSRFRYLERDDRYTLYRLNRNCYHTPTQSPSTPTQTCHEQDCGARPDSYLCPDGETMAGYTGECRYNDDTHGCEWELFTTCPTCRQTSDCNSLDQFCSYGECRQVGTCGQTVDCYNPENAFLRVGCVPIFSCEANQCRTECCTTVTRCARDPCEEECSRDYTVCVADYCGGCNADFFRDNGQAVCNRHDS